MTLRKLFLFLLVVSLTTLTRSACATNSRDEEKNRVAAIARAIPASISVFGPGGKGGGSGVVISPSGYALTNYHVVESCDSFMKCSMPDGVLYDAVIVGIDPTGDVALIKLLGREDFPAAVLADSDQVRAGDDCFAGGNPFLLATDFQPSVSWGIVSGVHRYQYPAGTLLEYTDCIQTDAAINPGNSGGPLFNAGGELIGINGRGSFEKRGRVNVGVGYAISINQIKNFLDHLKSGRIVDHATLGATVSTDEQGKVRVSNILESSDAFRQGLNVDDELVRFAGREIQTANQFKNVLGIHPKGWRVPLTIRRNGTESDLDVRLTGVHATEELIEIVQGPQSEISTPDEKKKPSDNPSPDAEQQSKRPEQGPTGQMDSLFVAKRGFANFYFNQLQRNRVWQGFLRHGDFSKFDCTWRLRGSDQEQQPFTVVLANEQSGIQRENETYVLDNDQDLAMQLENSKLQGLLVSMHIWRKLLVAGPDRLGNVIYFGGIPERSSGSVADCLVGTHESVECYALFDKFSSRLIELDLFAGPHSSTCTLEFLGYQMDGELAVPSTIHVSFLNETKTELKIDQIEFLTDKLNDD